MLFTIYKLRPGSQDECCYLHMGILLINEIYNNNNSKKHFHINIWISRWWISQTVLLQQVNQFRLLFNDKYSTKYDYDKDFRHKCGCYQYSE